MKRMLAILMALAIMVTMSAGAFCALAEGEGAKALPMEYADPREKIALDDTLTVTGGEIRGFHYENSDIQTYMGIPYAEPPIGDLRWTAAQDPSPWEGVKDCMAWGNSAIQTRQQPYSFWSVEYIVTDKNYSEDCLTLNVWTNGDDTQKPVLVFIHGGANTSGGSSCAVYEGEELAKKGVVVVTINYRLSFLGFLATEELREEDPVNVGNYALTDHIQALKWVQENIEQFGGDKNNVTIMGQSAGASNVCTIMASPAADGLYHKAAILSGVSISTEDMTVDEKIDATMEKIEKFAEKDGKDYSLESMRTFETDDLTNFIGSARSMNVGTELLPTGFFNRVLAGEEPPVPVMTGMVLGDGAMFGGKGDTPEEIENSLAYAPTTFSAARSEGTTYAYIFTRDVPGPNEEISGPQHTYEVPYFFNILHPVRNDYWEEADKELANVMSDYLVNFMMTGDPNGEGLAEWTPCGQDGVFLEIDTTCTMKQIAKN